jgi:septal ring factor EnvC (AmiA/AmiB activator)
MIQKIKKYFNESAGIITFCSVFIGVFIYMIDYNENLSKISNECKSSIVNVQKNLKNQGTKIEEILKTINELDNSTSDLKKDINNIKLTNIIITIKADLKSLSNNYNIEKIGDNQKKKEVEDYLEKMHHNLDYLIDFIENLR